jgi:hypothetical protein
MRIATASSQDATARDQFDRLTALVEEALAESNALHHRIRESQLRITELSASIEAGHPVSVVRSRG